MKALVVGCQGQDGSYLVEQLNAAGVEAYGLSRQGLHDPQGALLESMALEREADMHRLLSEKVQAARIFYLPAYHHSSEEAPPEEGALIRRSFEVHAMALLGVLEGMRLYAPEARLFYAASSHLFGAVQESPQRESTPLNPICPYGVSKTAGVNMCRMYRRRHGLFCSVGYLYNHDSPRRGPRFLTRRIVQTALAIAAGEADELVVGNPAAQVDMGYAPEYADAMIRILNLDHSDDFILSSGRLVSIQAFIEAVFDHLKLDWRDHLKTDPSLIRKSQDRGVLLGDNRKLKKATGWQPKTGIRALAEIMIEAERH
ncbi:MAG: GDP-mannose 4,6-dehydratase [Magnetococcales bacterium]|nr:GDP-mannose 4,6-dehydratase [Magnetococcales bacterium]